MAPEWLQHRRAWFQSLKERPCDRCGVEYPYYAMDWHHRDPANKSFELNEVSRYGRKRLLAEIEKCDLLCANCHRITHWEEEAWTYERLR